MKIIETLKFYLDSLVMIISFHLTHLTDNDTTPSLDSVSVRSLQGEGHDEGDGHDERQDPAALFTAI